MLVAAGAALAALAAQYAGSAISANRQDINNRSAMREQNEWNLAQWQRENEYNSPKAQMQRFADAGLNPNLIYGQGTNGNAGHITSAPSQPRKSADIGQMISQLLPAYMNLKLQEQQLEKGSVEIAGMRTDNAIKENFGMLQAGANYRNTLMSYNKMQEEYDFMKKKAPIELDNLFQKGLISKQELMERKAKLPFVLAGMKANLASQYYDIRKQEAFDPYWSGIAKNQFIYGNLQNASADERIAMSQLDRKIKSARFDEWNSEESRGLRDLERSLGYEKGMDSMLDFTPRARRFRRTMRNVKDAMSVVLPIAGTLGISKFLANTKKSSNFGRSIYNDGTSDYYDDWHIY